MIFVNLPVKDLQRSTEFYTALGYGTNPQFSDENATNVVISDSIYLMLLVEPYFKTFTDKQVIDAATSIQTILALSADSREDVDELVDKALAAGGAAPKGPEDHGFMYQRSFTDPDGAPVRDPLDGPERPAADVTATVPNRITWAVDLLDLQPHHRVMEIGCGPGVAAGVIADRLGSGRLVAIDRSATAIDRATRRNQRLIEAGRVEFRRAGLVELAAPDGPFDAVIAMNVNLFWTGPAEPEWRVLDAVLARHGLLTLAYGYKTLLKAGEHDPAVRQSDRRSKIVAALRRHGYAVTTATADGCWAVVGRR
jgi:predicted lactoylglutathione lyase